MMWPTRSRSQSIVGLHFEGAHVHAVQLSRGVDEGPLVSAPLALGLAQAVPADLGRELRVILDGAGIRERRCIVSVPPAWMMAIHLPLPALSPADVESFLQLEAERGFPCDLDALQLARSFQKIGESTHVTLVGVRREPLERLAEALKIAGLKPVSFTLGLATLPGVVPPPPEGVVTLALASGGATLLIAAGGGITALRALDTGGAVLGRELRVTLEDIPADLRPALRQLRLVGDESTLAPLAADLAAWANTVGLQIEMTAADGSHLAHGLARHGLDGEPALPEFLPPRPSRWQQLVQRYNSRRLATVGAAVAAVLLFGLGMIGWQEYRAWALRAEWAAMQSQVDALTATQDRIREFRPWHDTAFRNLNLLRLVTEAFPENGSVTAKSIEIRSLSNITVSGSTRDNAALLHALDLLRQRPEVTSLQVEQIRGKSPAQFTFSFRLGSASAP